MQYISSATLVSQKSLFHRYLTDLNWREKYFGFQELNTEIWERKKKELLGASYPLEKIAEILKKYYETNHLLSYAHGLDKLKLKNCLVVMVGQQPGLFGGPLYNLYKAISAIQLARQLEKDLGVPIVPIYWNASNDHDVLEANDFAGMNGNYQLQNFRFSGLASMPLSYLDIEKQRNLLWQTLQKSLYHSTYLSEMKEIFVGEAKCWGVWQTEILMKIFGKHGLLVFEPNSLLSLSKNIFIEMFEKQNSMNHLIQKNSDAITQEGFSPQVESVSQCRFMAYQKGLHRERLREDQNQYRYREDKYSLNGLMEATSNASMEILPDALGRPIWQNFLFPALCYLAGPGEISYYHQLHGVSEEVFHRPAPFILPRGSFVMWEKRQLKYFAKNNWKIEDYPKHLKNHQMAEDLSEIQGDGWLKSVPDEATSLQMAKHYDRYRRKLADLEKKFYLKRLQIRLNEEGVGRKQWQEASQFLWPLGFPQERTHSFLSILMRRGLEVIEPLLQESYQFGKQGIVEI